MLFECWVVDTHLCELLTHMELMPGKECMELQFFTGPIFFSFSCSAVWEVTLFLSVSLWLLTVWWMNRVKDRTVGDLSFIQHKCIKVLEILVLCLHFLLLARFQIPVGSFPVWQLMNKLVMFLTVSQCQAPWHEAGHLNRQLRVSTESLRCFRVLKHSLLKF